MIQSRYTAVVLSGTHTLGQKPTQTRDRLLQTPTHTHSNLIDTLANLRGRASSALIAEMVLLLPKLKLGASALRLIPQGAIRPLRVADCSRPEELG